MSYAATSGSISVVDLVDEIRRLQGSDRFALVEVRVVAVLVESTQSSLAGQIGVDGAAYGHKRSRGADSAREEFLSPLEIVVLLFTSFFLITFTRLLLLPFFLPENQFEARCNARYEHPEGDLTTVQAAAKKPEIS